MLWFKAWRETRSRFLICLFGIAALCVYGVWHDYRLARPGTPPPFYYTLFHGVHGLLASLWLGAVNLLMMGGLLREKAAGVASFTLALPVSRKRLIGVRVGVALFQALALIVLPSTAVWLELAVIGKPYPASQVWFHFVLMWSGGLVFLAIALLVASLVEGEYTAPVVSFGVVVGTAFVLGDPRIQAISPFRFMGGIDYFDRPSGLLVGPIPLAHAVAYILLAALLTAAAVKAIEAREF
ncbi:MAG: ABC-2 transporter permease [Bryobacteraceae bacterium]|jgi:ABC-2 type transport system permease protein